MSENDKFNPLFPENENKQENSFPVADEENNTAVSPVSGETSELPVSPDAAYEKEGADETSELPLSDGTTQELSVNPAEQIEEKAAGIETVYSQQSIPVGEDEIIKAEAFNPYAYHGKDEADSTVSADSITGITEAYRSYGSQQVNPSYSQPLNQPREFKADNYQSPDSGKSDKGGNGKIVAIGIVAVCVVVAVVALVSSFFGGNNDTETTQQSTSGAVVTDYVQGQTTTQNITIATTQAQNEVANSVWVAEKVRPSVVGVMAYQNGELAGEGSGVLMGEDGTGTYTYVVTCAHVIDGSNLSFGVLLLDGRSFDAEIVALDVRTDIGVLKIKQTGLPLAEFGDSSSLRVGEPIYAIGNPGGSEYFGSITNGIVAAIDRSISATYTMTCIQHNAAINPGNSGGALVNTAGQVIGINSSKIARTDYEGMGFAVPSSIFKSVVEALIKYGYVPNRPELGISYASVSDYQLYSMIVTIKDLPRESVIIADIPSDSALAGTQAQVGDLIIAVNGKKMDDSSVLLDLIDTGAVGDTLTLTLCRIESRTYKTTTFDITVNLIEDKGATSTTEAQATLPQQDGAYGDFDIFDFFGW